VSILHRLLDGGSTSVLSLGLSSPVLLWGHVDIPWLIDWQRGYTWDGIWRLGVYLNGLLHFYCLHWVAKAGQFDNITRRIPNEAVGWLS